MINRVILRGFVADDPLIRATERGHFARVRLATIEHLQSGRTGVNYEHIEWHTLAFWGEMAKVVDREVRLGDSIEVEGRLRTREWVARDGVEHKTTEIVVDSLKQASPLEGYTMPRKVAESYQQKMERSGKITAINDQRSDCEDVTSLADDPDGLPF